MSHESDFNPTAANINAIVELERQSLKEASLGERIGQSITDAVGSVKFVVLQMLAMSLWMGFNSAAPEEWRFDPYPYGLLTFIVSLEGVLIATFVLMAQNRMSKQTDQRDHLNLQVSMLAEQEMTLMLKLLRQITERLDITPEHADAARAERLAEDTNVYSLVQSIRRELPTAPGAEK